MVIDAVIQHLLHSNSTLTTLYTVVHESGGRSLDLAHLPLRRSSVNMHFSRRQISAWQTIRGGRLLAICRARRTILLFSVTNSCHDAHESEVGPQPGEDNSKKEKYSELQWKTTSKAP